MHSDVQHLRRRQLIEATITTIYKKGFARTTLAMVAEEAGLSQGIVNFYFKTKEGLLFETLSYLADEYKTASRLEVERASNNPVAALNAMIEIDLGRKICSRRKVSVWMAFFSEASSRPKYRKLCTDMSAGFFEQASGMCRQIAQRSGYDDINPDSVARNLNALISGFWLDLAMAPLIFDREEAKLACRQLLAASFPHEFAATLSDSVRHGAA